jgi:hypothetical protein
VIVLVPIMALVNAARGGNFGAEGLPGHPRWWATIAVFFVALAALPWPQAALFAAGFLLWCLPPWGHLMCLNRYAPPRPISTLEISLMWLCCGCVHGALWLRHWLILPMVFAATWSPWALVVAPAIACFIVLAYELGWRLTPAAPIRTAEILTGAILGALLLSGCARLDTNGYHARGGSTGSFSCKGACP